MIQYTHHPPLGNSPARVDVAGSIPAAQFSHVVCVVAVMLGTDTKGLEIKNATGGWRFVAR